LISIIIKYIQIIADSWAKESYLLLYIYSGKAENKNIYGTALVFIYTMKEFGIKGNCLVRMTQNN